MNRVTTVGRSQCYCMRISKISPFLIASDLVCVMGGGEGEVLVTKCFALFSTTLCCKHAHHNIKIRCKLQLKKP